MKEKKGRGTRDGGAKDGGDIEMEDDGSDGRRTEKAGNEKHPSTDHEYLGSRGI